MSESISRHSELMDGIYRYQRHIYDVTRKYYLLGRDRMIKNLCPPKDGSVLEIGCGTGRNLVAVGQTYKDVKLYGFDISSEMLASARNSTAKSLSGRTVKLALGDATQFDPMALFGRSTFDRVFISYSLSMIPGWETALEHAFRALAPGGQLHIVDFGHQKAMPKLFRIILQKWLTLFHVSPREDLEVALRGLAHRHNAKLSFRSLFRDYSQMAIITRGQ